MVIIKETPDGNWEIEADWMLPEKVAIENGEIQNLRDKLVEMFGLPE